MQQPLESFPFSSRLQEKLKAAGFEISDDLKDISVAELSKELCVSTSEALEILNILSGRTISTTLPQSQTWATEPCPAATNDGNPLPDVHQGQSALELLQAEQALPFIVTFSAMVDKMLGGGIALRKITELCGAPGIGKTQFSMQLAVDVCIPKLFGGVEGEAIYIDTEGSFIVERVAEMATAAVQHISKVAEESEDSELVEMAKGFTLDKVLAGMHYFRCHDYVELVALVNILPQFVAEHHQVRLVVVDSVASPFRHGFEDMGLRNRILSGMAQNLIKLATLNDIAVVFTNQMTTKLHIQPPTSSQLVPALGESWGHVSTVRVVLYWSQAQRFAMLYKSPTRPEAVVPFQVTQDGVRDAVKDAEGLSSQESDTIQEWQFLSSTQLDELENCLDEHDFSKPRHAYTAKDNFTTEAGDSPELELVKSRKRTHPEP